MTLQTVEDFDLVKKRMNAWWHHDLVDRVAVMVTAPRATPLPMNQELPQPATIAQEWTDPQYYAYKIRKWASQTYCGGDMFPTFPAYLGPGQMAGFLGCPPTYVQTTVWYHPILSDLNSFHPFRFDANHPHYQLTKSMLRLALSKHQDWLVPTTADLGGPMDVAQAVRGSDLLLDLLDAPANVHQLIRNIQDIWFTCFDDLKKEMDGKMDGFCTTFNLWCEEDYYPLQCDFSAMISPALYGEFVLPYVAQQVDRLTYSLYHLDGPEAIPHLDQILSLKKLHAIQWVPGAGKPQSDDPVWIPLYKEIQAAGKSLALWDAKKDHVQQIIRELNPKGLLIHIAPDQFATEAEARDFVKQVESWTASRIRRD